MDRVPVHCVCFRRDVHSAPGSLVANVHLGYDASLGAIPGSAKSSSDATTEFTPS
jgi:hypothetical protein